MLSGSILAARSALGRPSRLQFLLGAAVLAILVSVGFDCPKFWIFRQPQPGTFEWSRALTYLSQCQAGWTQAAPEPALRWRLLPPLVARLTGRPVVTGLLLPYLGLFALTVAWAAAAERLTGDRVCALLATLLLATTGGFITVTSWLGLNDAWFMLGLLAVATAPGSAPVVIAGLLAPWVDERFLLGWPLAMACRLVLFSPPVPLKRVFWLGTASLTPYVAARLLATAMGGDAPSHAFFREALRSFPHYAGFLYFGLWSGLRAAWLVALIAVLPWSEDGAGWHRRILALCAVAGFSAAALLASDFTRDTDVLLPLLICGIATLRRRWGDAAVIVLAACVLFNLAEPAFLSTSDKLEPIWSLPMEVLRLVRIPPG